MENPSSFFISPSSEERDWAWLPENTLFQILSHLFLLSEMFSFGTVCSRWHSVLKHRLSELGIQPNMSLSRNLPMLLNPTSGGVNEITRNLFSVVDSTTYDVKLQVPYNNRCIGSSHGWLIFLNSVTFVVTMYNPFYFGSSKGSIHLPPFDVAEDVCDMRMKKDCEFYSDYFIGKAILSSDPSDNYNYYMMVIYGGTRNLAYYSSEDSSWSYLSCPHGIFDIIYQGNHFLAVDDWGEVFVCDVRSNLPMISVATEPVMGPIGGATRRYIVEFSGANTFLQAVRLVEITTAITTTTNTTTTTTTTTMLKTTGFLVYKLEVWDDSFEWIPVSEIQGGALFLGDNCSTFVNASDFPGLHENAIYFIADYYDPDSMFKESSHIIGYGDNGIFLIEDGIFLSRYMAYPQPNDLPPPIWILPTI